MFSDKFTLKLEFKSRYGQITNASDYFALKARIENWIDQIIEENNTSNKHIGLHFEIDRWRVKGGVENGE